MSNKNNLIDRLLSNVIDYDFMRNYKKLQSTDIEKTEKSINVTDLVCGIPYVKKIYCINLQSCPERKTHMKKQFKKYNFDVIFFNAIHPRHKEFKRRYHNPYWVDQGWDNPRCYCVVPCDHRVRKLRHTEVAISLSHYYIYEKIANREEAWALICEDDVIFNENFCEILNHVIPKSIWENEEQATIIFCGGAKDNYKLQITNLSDFGYQEMPNGCYSNYCYLINLAAAKLLHRKFFPITRPEDSFKRYWIGKDRIKAYRISPVIVGELSSGTNFDPIYNRLSLHKPPPRVNILPEQEYQKQYLEEEKKRRNPPPPPKAKRTIIYSTKRTTTMKVYNKNL